MFIISIFVVCPNSLNPIRKLCSFVLNFCLFPACKRSKAGTTRHGCKAGIFDLVGRNVCLVPRLSPNHHIWGREVFSSRAAPQQSECWDVCSTKPLHYCQHQEAGCNESVLLRDYGRWKSASSSLDRQGSSHQKGQHEWHQIPKRGQKACPENFSRRN